MPRPDDPQILECMAEGILVGQTIENAAARAGIGATTAREWYRLGSEQLEAWQGTQTVSTVPEAGSHALFAFTVKQAEAALIQNRLARIDEAGTMPQYWAANMTLLERRFPQDFGRRDRLDVDQRSVSISVNVSLDQLPPDALPALQEAIRRIQDEGTPPPPALTEGSTHTDSAPAPGTGT